jgi:hypothetical protein
VKADRRLPDVLDSLENVLAFLAADGVTQQATKEADVFAERQVLVGQLRCRHRISVLEAARCGAA